MCLDDAGVSDGTQILLGARCQPYFALGRGCWGSLVGPAQSRVCAGAP